MRMELKCLLCIIPLLWASLAFTQGGYIGPKGYIGPNGIIGAGGPGGTAAFVQEKDCALWFGGSGTTQSCAFTATPGAGNGIVLMFGWGTNTSTVSSVVDGNSAAYSLITWASGATSCQLGGADMRAYQLANSAGTTGAKTITITWSADPGFGQMSMMEFSGVPTTSMVDKADCQAVAVSNTPVSPSVTTTGADALYSHGFSFSAGNHTWTAGTSPAYTFRGTNGSVFGDESFIDRREERSRVTLQPVVEPTTFLLGS